MKRTFAAARERVLKIAEARLPALTRLKRPEALPITLERRRIYVLPTRHGLFFGGLLCAMTIGALNYNNNPALMLCFLMLSAAHTSLLRAYLAMRGLRLEHIVSEPVHAGDVQTLRLLFSDSEARPRRGIVAHKEDVAVAFSVEAGARADVRLSLAAPTRGWHAIGRLRLSTTHPLGLFVVWSWVNPEVYRLVYPKLEAAAPALPGRGDRGTPKRRKGPDEELHSLRDYRAGDPLRLMAWKRSAQIGRAMVREFESPAGSDVLLDWRELGALEPEARIRRLARWVVDADRQGMQSTLIVPGNRIGPASGSLHVQACLRELALMP